MPQKKYIRDYSTILSNKELFIMRISLFSIIIFSIFACSKHSPASLNTSRFNQIDSNQIQLGRFLFYDTRLSSNNTKSCGTCHNPVFAFTDGYKRSLGIYADVLQRNTTALFNLKEQKYLTFADSNIKTLLRQIENPLFNEHPLEMGVKGNEVEILNRIKQQALYQKLFQKADLDLSWQSIKLSITRFVSTLTSYQSPYDFYLKGDLSVYNESQLKGMQLFFSDSLNCSKCHGGINFSTPKVFSAPDKIEYFFNTGLYNVGDKNEYPKYDQGLLQYTHNQLDMGKFRVPSLRNLIYTKPYYHDGSEENLKGVILNYENGGRQISNGEYKGDGRKNKYKSELIKGFKLSDYERISLIKFLESLSDPNFIQNPKYQDPFNNTN